MSKQQQMIKGAAQLAGKSGAPGGSNAAGGSDGGVTADWRQPNNTMSLAPLQVMQPGTAESRNCGGTAGILPMERKKASFAVEELTNILDGGKDKTVRRRFIMSPTEDLDMSSKYYMERAEQMKTHLKHFFDVHDEWFNKGYTPTREEVAWMSENSMISGTMMNHYGLFLPTLLSQASDEQQMWWLPRAFMGTMIGCYAQTELGHGSNVRGLQTLAQYDAKSEEFVISTPTLLSIKWWPGTLGKLCTHALVYAQLLINGKEYGVHTFMVQVRDEHHRPLPGIEVGDLGPKMGDGANDTGFMRLENVRVPREHMLNRFQRVKPDGTYVKSEAKTNDKMHYATMMFTRGQMMRTAGGHLAKAVVIGVRYSAVRRQGFKDTKGTEHRAEENQVIDYQVQRYRLFKQLALAYTIKFAGRWMTDKFKDLEAGNVGMIMDTSSLPEIAATSAGLKALCTYLAAQGIEDVRKCCGGNGYLLSAGLATEACDYVWQTTAEGDWIILMLQTARFLVKSLQSARKGEATPGPCDYMSPVRDPKYNVLKGAPPTATKVSDFFRLDYLLELYKYHTLVRLVLVVDELDERMRGGMSWDDAWNACALELITVVRNHCYSFMLTHFVEAVEEVKTPAIKAVLSRVCALFALSNMLDEQWAGVLDIERLRLVRVAVAQLLDALRPDAVALVDAFDIPDRVLNSAIGRFDGNVYEALYEAAKKSQLNQVDPFDGYKELLAGRLDQDLLKHRNQPMSKL